MNGRLAAAALLAMLAGCQRPADTPNIADTPGTNANAARPAVASTSNAPQRQIGTVSNLHGTTSGLKGVVSGFEVRRTETATVAMLAADTLFDFDSAILGAGAADNLRRTATLVRDGGQGTVRVVGHTDAKGSDSYNDDLSRRRAQAVATWLQGEGGLNARAFAVEGHGKREPIAPNTTPGGDDDPAGRARNRRVEVIIPR